MDVQDIRDADAIILGAPGRQGGMCGEMRLFLDSLAPLQVELRGSAQGALKVE
jgi:multimeric flavodoxin WrbA